MTFEQIQREWVNTQGGDMQASRSAWDSVAADYRPREEIGFSKDPFLRFLADRITLRPDMTALDIGCGAGAYALALARRLGQVVGSDLSPKMIELAERSASEVGVKNAAFVCENWYDCDLSDREGAFDLVYAHMTPAIADYKSFEKMLRCARRYCVIEKPVRRTNALTEAVRQAAGLEPQRKAEDDTVYAFAALWKLGFNPEVHYRRETWSAKKTLQEAKIWQLGRLKGEHSLTVSQEQAVERVLEKHAVNGVVEDKTDTTIVTIFWEMNA